MERQMKAGIVRQLGEFEVLLPARVVEGLAAIRSIVAAARATSPGRIAAPGLAKLVRCLFEDVRTMVEAVTAGDEAVGSAAANRLSALQTRLSAEYDEI